MNFTPNPITGDGEACELVFVGNPGRPEMCVTSGPYSISQNGARVTETLIAPHKWSIKQSGPLSFVYGNPSSPFLTANLQLLELQEEPTSNGVWGAFSARMVITGGSSQSHFVNFSGVAVQAYVLIYLPSGVDLSTLSLGQTEYASVAGGPVDRNFDPTPEPATMLLVTSGLLGLGGLVRRRRGA
jgi:hypothetical protein